MITLGLISAIYHKKFFLSLLLRLEMLLLKLILYKIYIGIIRGKPKFTTFSIFIIALSAVEARIGISLIALLSRRFQRTNIRLLKTLKK